VNYDWNGLERRNGPTTWGHHAFIPNISQSGEFVRDNAYQSKQRTNQEQPIAGFAGLTG